MNLEEQFVSLEKNSAMSLSDLCSIVLDSEFELLDNDVNGDDCLVFFGEKGKQLYKDVNVNLRRNSEYNAYVLVFELS